MTHLLQFTDQRTGEQHYFQRLGSHWPHVPDQRLIERTTPFREKAAAFDTLAAALEVYVIAGRPPDWRVLELDGDTVKQIIEP